MKKGILMLIAIMTMSFSYANEIDKDYVRVVIHTGKSDVTVITYNDGNRNRVIKKGVTADQIIEGYRKKGYTIASISSTFDGKSEVIYFVK